MPGIDGCGRAWRRRAAAAVMVFAAAGPLRGEPVLTPRMVAGLRSVGSAVVSPDGALIAYVLQVPRDVYGAGDSFEDGPAWSELHVCTVADGSCRPFVTGEVHVESVAWTRDGRGISFLAKRGKDKHKALYVIPIDGGEARRVLSHATDIASYSWSPDGRRVAFLAAEEAPKARKALSEKGFTAEVYEEDDRRTLAWVSAVEPGDAKPTALDLPGSASALHWSPAGDRLCVALAPTPRVDDEYMRRKVHVVEAGSGKTVMRFDNPGKLGALAWSPDGRHLAMISGADLHDPSEGRLLVGSVADGRLTDVLPGLEGHVSALAWQDAGRVMFVADEGCRTSFGKVGVDGSGRKAIVPAEKAAILGEFTLSRDGSRAAFVAAAPHHPAEVYFMAHGEAAPRRLTDSNPSLAGVGRARQEVVNFQARDGVSLEGILIHPLEEEARMLYPLIVYVHGGPEAHERDGWLTNYSRPGQVAAARGFFVFYPNYRGSTGRGVAFSKLGQGDEAGAEFNDLVDAVEFLAGKYPIDRSKVGVTGGSYGGYASAWCATALSEHFAAAVMFVGISNTISKKGTTDIPEEDYLVHTRSRMWDDKWLFYLERSPIYHVKKAKTPILILHGKNDTRVHPGQSMELYRHLKTLGQAPVRLVLYPGEGHGNRKAALRLDYHLRMLQWMEHYLKGPGGAPPPGELDYGLEAADKPAGSVTASVAGP
jgi:dipeptidyl aminopeptidase/acylaminoacyl peptidase